MKNTERLYVIATEVLSVRIPITIGELAIKLEVAENTAKNDLRELEYQGVAYCSNPNGKPQLWFAAKPLNHLDMSLELAFALNSVNEVVKTMLPVETYQSIEHVFDLAHKFYFKKRNANHQSKVVRFECATNRVDLNRHLVLNNIQVDVLSTIKSALSSNSDLTFETQNGELTLSKVSLSEIDGRLFLKGMMEGHSYHIDTLDISEIREVKDIPIWQSKRRLAA
jgi:predicted DNA-binding transcriptional regulator YafY